MPILAFALTSLNINYFFLAYSFALLKLILFNESYKSTLFPANAMIMLL